MSEISLQSIQSNILDAVVASFSGPGASLLDGAPLKAYRLRFTDFAAAELPAINVVPDDEVDEDQSTDDVTLHHRFHVRYMAAKADAADLLADRLYVAGHRTLMRDPAVRAMVTRIHKTGRKWETERGEVEIVTCVATYEVEFSTDRSDPSVAGY